MKSGDWQIKNENVSVSEDKKGEEENWSFGQ
jgi:hypothetical protein